MPVAKDGERPCFSFLQNLLFVFKLSTIAECEEKSTASSASTRNKPKASLLGEARVNNNTTFFSFQSTTDNLALCPFGFCPDYPTIAEYRISF